MKNSLFTRKTTFIFLLFQLALFSCSDTTTKTEDTYSRVETILSKMTLEEKAGQMTQVEIGRAHV
jgi:hypothetical protein